RPALMKAVPGQRNLNKYYRYFAWIYPIGRALFPGIFCTLQELALAMIHATAAGAKPILEVRDIVNLSRERPN
ncbi:MAG TPA: hypothetical protein VKU83_01555, partial [Puia sp.]|nr:hypothetical protein [Puia sp.]